jgi:hypothetical protein
MNIMNMENPEFNLSEKYPEPMDLVKLDGRWAQAKGGGAVISFLDNGEVIEIDWNQYNLIKFYGRKPLARILEANPEWFTEEEVEAVHWAGDDANPEFKKMAPVFGEYKKLIPV